MRLVGTPAEDCVASLRNDAASVTLDGKRQTTEQTVDAGSSLDETWSEKSRMSTYGWS